MASDFDVIIIGAGPAGYVAAIRASQLNLKVAIVEREHLGGICLNWGCIPTKALLRSAEIYRLMQHAKDFGLSADNISFDLTKIVERSRGIAKQLNGGIGHLLKKNKVTNISGTATVKGGGKLSVKASDGKETVYNTKNIIIATGARARELPHLGVDGKQVVTYKNAMTPEVMPKSLLVIGSGAIGIEFASFYNTFGVDVTVVEMADRILPVEDAEISATAEKSFKGQGMKIITNASVDAVSKAKDGVTCSVKNAKTGKTDKIKVDRVISAVGIVPNTEGLGLEALNIKTERGHIVIDGFGKTNIDGVYAIGDVTPGPWLAHKASHEAILCIDKIAGLPNLHPMDKSNIPGCTYCHPQIAS
ncbi:MAG: dihydrolipoamide dehydrogenase, partial [Alphaproteobacteria bacterium]